MLNIKHSVCVNIQYSTFNIQFSTRPLRVKKSELFPPHLYICHNEVLHHRR